MPEEKLKRSLALNIVEILSKYWILLKSLSNLYLLNIAMNWLSLLKQPLRGAESFFNSFGLFWRETLKKVCKGAADWFVSILWENRIEIFALSHHLFPSLSRIVPKTFGRARKYHWTIHINWDYGNLSVFCSHERESRNMSIHVQFYLVKSEDLMNDSWLVRITDCSINSGHTPHLWALSLNATNFVIPVKMLFKEG